MFNQKVNHFTSQNPDYLNHSLGAPGIRALDIHNCGTTIQKYKKVNNLPLQTWCSPETAVEAFGMRPIVNSKEYFENIRKYLGSIIYTDSILLKQSMMPLEQYYMVVDYGFEPQSSFLQAINLELTDKLMELMAEACNNIGIFKNLNPLKESLVVTDIDIITYKSSSNDNHYFQKCIFSAVNTTRYNTISFKAEAYQDTTPMMDEWNRGLGKVLNSQDISKQTNSNSVVYVSIMDLLNNTSCDLPDCEFKGYSSSEYQGYNNNINWLQPNTFTNNTYNSQGNYDTEGNIKIYDQGPSNINDIISKMNLRK
jgi:hypothetical protein